MGRVADPNVSDVCFCENALKLTVKAVDSISFFLLTSSFSLVLTCFLLSSFDFALKIITSKFHHDVCVLLYGKGHLVIIR